MQSNLNRARLLKKTFIETYIEAIEAWWFCLLAAKISFSSQSEHMLETIRHTHTHTHTAIEHYYRQSLYNVENQPVSREKVEISIMFSI